MQNLSEKKTELRKKALLFRKNLGEAERSKKSEAIFKKLLALDIVNNCKSLLCYVSCKNEVDTSSILNYCFNNDIKVAVPRCIDGEKMKFYYIKGKNDLQKGMYGIYEPKKYCKECLSDKDCVLIAPALIADEKGFRLGFGKGYYDRFLSDFKGKSIVLVYKQNLIKNLFKNEFDKCCDYVITD